MASRRAKYWGSCVAQNGPLEELIDQAQPGDLVVMEHGKREWTWFVEPDGSLTDGLPIEKYAAHPASLLNNFESARSDEELDAAAGPSSSRFRRITSWVFALGLTTAILGVAASGLLQDDRRELTFRVDAANEQSFDDRALEDPAAGQCEVREPRAVRCSGDILVEGEWKNGDWLYGPNVDSPFASAVEAQAGALVEVFEQDRGVFYRLEDRSIVRMVAALPWYFGIMFVLAIGFGSLWRLAPPSIAPLAQRSLAAVRGKAMMLMFIVPIMFVVVSLVAGIEVEPLFG